MKLRLYIPFATYELLKQSDHSKNQNNVYNKYIYIHKIQLRNETAGGCSVQLHFFYPREIPASASRPGQPLTFKHLANFHHAHLSVLLALLSLFCLRLSPIGQIENVDFYLGRISLHRVAKDIELPCQNSWQRLAIARKRLESTVRQR